jgi:hypothetical protein
MAVAVQDPHGQLTDPNPLVAEWRDKIKQAKEDRKRFEPTWLSNLAFAAGKHYLMWDRFQRTLVMPRDLQEAMGRGELYTSDVITERRMRALGEMSADDDRPELLLVDGDGDGVQQDYAEQVNRAVGHGWDHEWDGDEVMLELRRKIIDLGTAAVSCRFDAQAGPVKQDQVPFMDGKPLLDPEQARAHVAEMASAGATADIRSIHEGRIRWEVLSPFNILVPPGVEHESDFPWEIVVRPVPLERVQAEYGDVAADLKEDTDIGNIMGLTSNSDVDGSRQGGGATESSRLRNHVWVYTCYLRPTSRYPKGRKVVLASNEYRLMEVKDELPYVGPDGDYRSGIAYYHWWRVTGRFFSRSLVEPMKDVQRRINKRTNQIDKTIDRDQPVVFVDKNGNARKRKGFPMEVIALEPTERQPIVSQGHGPGAWMYEDKADAIADLDRASTIGQSALGENPENAQTYGQLALLHEQEAGKRQVIKKEHQAATATLIEDSVYDIRTYWGVEKQILMDSDDDQVEARVFNATKIPPFFIVRAAKGASKPSARRPRSCRRSTTFGRPPSRRRRRVEPATLGPLVQGIARRRPGARASGAAERRRRGQGRPREPHAAAGRAGDGRLLRQPGGAHSAAS